MEKLIVKYGIGVLVDKDLKPIRMTRTQAQRYAERNMPSGLRKANFEAFVARSCPDLHGGDWFRINYGMQCKS